MRTWLLVSIKPRRARDADGADLGPIARMHLQAQGYGVLWLHYLAAGLRGLRVLRSYYPALMYVCHEAGVSDAPIAWAPGVRGIVHFGAEPAIVPEAVIEAERERCLHADGLIEPPWPPWESDPRFKAGQLVRSYDAWAAYVACVEADDGRVVRVWREVWGRRVPFAYPHDALSPAAPSA